MVLTLVFSSRVPATPGYNADATKAITGLATHSSFHYEMVRVLAKSGGRYDNTKEQMPDMRRPSRLSLSPSNQPVRA